MEFLGTWEQIYNPDFKVVQFDHFKQKAGLYTFTLSVTDWVDCTNAVGIYVKRGRYGGTYAHKDIAFGGILGVVGMHVILDFLENDG